MILWQENEKYRGMVRQHMDLEGIESRVERGFYSSSLSLPFYRDLLLLFNNALVFYPKSSVESLAALDLLHLVSSHFRKTPSPASHSLSHSQISSSTPDAPERSDSLLPKHKSASAAAPIIVCRKRSSMSSQQPVNSDKKPALDSKPAHERGLIKMNATKERTVVTGTRSLRRSSNKIIKNTSPTPNPSKKQTPTSTSTEKAENSNSRAEGMVAASTKKRSAADFLKRIKRNSPAGGKSKNSGSESSNNNNNASNNKKANSKNNKNKKSEKGGEGRKEEGSPSKPRAVGRPPKKGGTPEYSNVKRGREVGGGKESASASASASASTLKRPRKRARR